MDEVGKLKQKIHLKLVKRLVFPFLLLAICILYLFMLYSAGMLDPVGYIKPYEVHTFSMIEDIAKKSNHTLISISITISMDNVIDPGITFMSGHYIAFKLEDKYIMYYITSNEYKALPIHGTYTFTGALQRIDDLTNVLVMRNFSNAQTMVYADYIDSCIPVFVVRTALFLLFIVGLVFTLFLFAKCVIPMVNVYRYPDVRKLPKSPGVADTFSQIEKQYANSLPSNKFIPGNGFALCLTANWIIIESPWSIRFYQAGDFLWAYKLVKVKKGKPKAAAKSNYEVHVHSKSELIRIPGDERCLDALVMGLQQAYPWLMIGHGPDKVNDWNNDIKKVVDAANAKKQKLGFHDFGV